MPRPNKFTSFSRSRVQSIQRNIFLQQSRIINRGRRERQDSGLKCWLLIFKNLDHICTVRQRWPSIRDVHVSFINLWLREFQDFFPPPPPPLNSRTLPVFPKFDSICQVVRVNYSSFIFPVALPLIFTCVKSIVNKQENQ